MTQEAKRDLKESLTILVLICNVAGVIWGAASLSKNVDHLQAAVHALEETFSRFNTIFYDLDARVRVLEDRSQR